MPYPAERGPGADCPDRSLLAGAPPVQPQDAPMRQLADMRLRGTLELPLPGHGATAQRWSALAEWGRMDLAMARLAEGHTDAVAILAEAGRDPVRGALYGVWAARSGGTGADLDPDPLSRDQDRWALHGTVRFCSGGHDLDRALVVAAAPGGSRIVDIALDGPGILRLDGCWHTIGMHASDSIDVEFQIVPARAEALVGEPGFYTDRLGFWWGGAGVAAVWLGGAAGVLDDVHDLLRAGTPDPHQLALLGELHATLQASDALLARTAAAIDADPKSDHRTQVWLARAACERTCRTVLDAVPRLVGVAAMTRTARLAQRLADLGIYARQHHGERDLAALGARSLDESR